MNGVKVRPNHAEWVDRSWEMGGQNFLAERVVVGRGPCSYALLEETYQWCCDGSSEPTEWRANVRTADRVTEFVLGLMKHDIDRVTGDCQFNGASRVVDATLPEGVVWFTGGRFDGVVLLQPDATRRAAGEA